MNTYRTIYGYEVSTAGSVLNPRTGQVLKPWNDRNGYLRVSLWKDGVRKNYYVHRLVAMAFIPNPDGLLEVNHINEDKTDNRVDNLEWCDRAYNNSYGTRNEKDAKAKSKTVYMYTLDDKLCGMWPSTAECGRHGFDCGTISKCCNGKYKKYRGFKWSYEPPKPLLALPYYPHCTSVQPDGSQDIKVV